MPASATLVDGARRARRPAARASEQQWPATMLPSNLWRSAASAMRAERAGLGVERLVDMEIEIEAVARGARNNRSSTGSSFAGSREGHGRRACRRCRATVVDDCRTCARRRARRRSGTARPPAARSGPSRLAHLGEHRPGDRCLRRELNRVGADGAGAVREGAAQRELHARARHPSRDQFASGRRRTASSAPMKLPSGLGWRGQIWPLSRWVWMSTKRRQHHAVVEAHGRRRLGLAKPPAPAARRSGRRRSRCRRDDQAVAAGKRSPHEARGTLALRSR